MGHFLPNRRLLSIAVILGALSVWGGAIFHLRKCGDDSRSDRPMAVTFSQ